MEELDIDFALNVSNKDEVVPMTRIKKHARRMSVQMREYKATKYKSSWTHSGQVKDEFFNVYNGI